MSWEFHQLLTGCQSVTPPGNYGRMFLLPAPGTATRGPTNWLIGAYKDQTKLATAIRDDAALQTFLQRHAVRLGLRDSDAAPALVTRKERFGAAVAGANANTNFLPQRLRQDATPGSSLFPAPDNRVTDRFQNKADFWDTQTPQSHHIVEFNHLAKLGVSHEVGSNDLDHAQLPCVLLAAEFHQKYISMILKETHHWDNTRLRTGIGGVYRRLYTQRSLLFHPLWDVSAVIFRVAGITV